MIVQTSAAPPMAKFEASVKFEELAGRGIAGEAGYVYHLSTKEKREVEMAMLHFKGIVSAAQ